MNKRLIYLIAPLVLICLFITSCAENQNTPNFDVPVEVLAAYENYMNAFKIGSEEAVKYAHIENDFIRETLLMTEDRLIEYKIESTEMINEKLYAFISLGKTTNTMLDSDDFQRAYNFVGLIDDKWYFMINVRDVPAELRENLDESRYIITGENIVDFEDVIQTPIMFPDN